MQEQPFAAGRHGETALPRDGPETVIAGCSRERGPCRGTGRMLLLEDICLWGILSFLAATQIFLRTFLRVRTSGDTEMQSFVEVKSLAKKLHTHAALSVCRRAVVENFPVMIAGKPFCSRQLWKSAMSFRYRPTPSLPGCVHRIVVRSGWSDRPGRNMLSRSHTRRIPNMLLQKAGDAQHGAPATALCSVRFWPADCRKDCSVVLWQADPCSERVG